MKIVVNAKPLLNKLTGVGVYVHQLSQALVTMSAKHDFVYHYGFASRRLLMRTEAFQNGFFNAIKPLMRRLPLGRRTLNSLTNTYFLRNIDLYFEPNFIPIIDAKFRRVVTTVHDFSFLNSQWVPDDRYEYFKTNFFARINRSDIIITPSAFIRQEVLEKLGYPPDRVVTIHHGIDHSIFREENDIGSKVATESPGAKKEQAVTSLPERFILFVGALQPRKNLVSLVQAYKSLDKGIRDYCKLVLVGFEGWNKDEILSTIASINNDVVIYDTVVSNQHLAKIYRKACALAFPSHYEGFGFPPLEAMACGCPVLVSNSSSLPEVCGDAALYVDPKDIQSIANGIQSILNDESLRMDLRAKGLERAKRFTWHRSALEHLKVFERAVQ